MAKKNKTPFGIFSESIGLYFSNFNKFMKYMTFPVLGQVFGLGITFLFLCIFTENIPKFIEKYPKFSDLNSLIIFSIIITLPGLIIFCKAFWEYLVAYSSINSMLDNMLKSGKVYDFKAHVEVVQRRAFAFIGLWLIISLFGFVAICPLFWIICGIAAVYMTLIFQAFTFETEISPVGCIKKSFSLIKGHFGSTFLLLFLAAVFTYIMIPQIFLKVFDIIKLTDWLSNLLLPISSLIPDFGVEKYGLITPASNVISKLFVQIIIAQIVIQYTLPQRAILWSLWYKELEKNNTNVLNNTVKKSKRPSEKLMHASNKKYSKKKIDSNILRRATEKDED